MASPTLAPVLGIGVTQEGDFDAVQEWWFCNDSKTAADASRAD
jgi:hypothetical protein